MMDVEGHSFCSFCGYNTCSELPQVLNFILFVSLGLVLSPAGVTSLNFSIHVGVTNLFAFGIHSWVTVVFWWLL